MIFLLLTFDKKTRQNSTLTGNKQGNRKERKCLLADERKPHVTEGQSHGPLQSSSSMRFTAQDASSYNKVT